MIQGIYGRTYIESSVPPAIEGTDLLSLWENRFRERLACIGSTESALIWRNVKSPAGWSISRLAPSTRHTNGTGSVLSPWPTVTTGTVRAGETPEAKKARGAHTGTTIPDLICLARSQWPTVKASAAGETSRGGDRKDEPLMGGLLRGIPMVRSFDLFQPEWIPAPMSQWVTVSARDGKDSSGMTADPGDRPSGQARLDQLPRQMVQLITGTMPNGSSVMTKKRGAPNPEFAFWLMGFPAAWTFGALQAMRSFRKRKRKLSPR